MKKGMLFLVTLALFLLLCPGLFAQAEEMEEPSEWTVLVYMCGSDLESKYGYGTGNLEEIATIMKPLKFAQGFESRDELAELDEMRTKLSKITQSIDGLSEISVNRRDKVHVLIETGGAKTWHAEKLGLKIRTDALQYWHFHAGEEDREANFKLEAERPLSSMAASETLADFIQWGVKSYPAKKYALVLWSHGGGSATGIFIDELFGGEYMTLDKLNEALSVGGAYFEAVIFDACMMANLETASAIREHAKWMIASEELVAGKGTAFGEWLQQLYHVPEADGRLLGRWVCDMSMIKYSDNNEKQAQELLTWSVINLSQVERLETNFDAFFAMMGVFYTRFPDMLTTFANAAHYYEAFGTGSENMYDLGGFMYDPVLRNSASAGMQMIMQQAMADAVDYCVRGNGRPQARGLSFCLASNFQSDQLDVYAHNCKSPHYLALLDAISPWEAPAWVYEQTEKLPELLEEGTYQVTVEKRIWKNGSPAFAVVDGYENISSVEYNLYKLDESTGMKIRLGDVPVIYDADVDLFRIYDLLLWPSFDGNLCEIELQNKVTIGDYNLLYNIPMMIDSEPMNMRIAYWFDSAEWEVLGLWEGYDNDSSQFNRNIMSLSQVAGREYNLIYEADGEMPSSRPYVLSPTMIMYRSMKLEEIILPPGTYYIDFTIYDVFMRPMRMETVELQTTEDHSIQIIGEPWEGTEILDAAAYYTDAK